MQERVGGRGDACRQRGGDPVARQEDQVRVLLLGFAPSVRADKSV